MMGGTVQQMASLGGRPERMSAISFSTRAAMDRKSARILPQYNSLHHRGWWKLASIVFVALALFLTVYTGFLVAIGGTLALRFVGFPILLMAGVSLVAGDRA